MYRYYLLMRGPGPGAIPKVWDNLVTKVEDFGTKKYVEEIGCKAWGYVEYLHRLTDKQLDAYELMEVETIEATICGFIAEALAIEHIISMPIEKFTVEQLNKLSEKAKKNKLLVVLRAEHSNAHQGILVCLIKKSVAAEFIKFL